MSLVKQTWYFHVFLVIIVLTAIASIDVLEMDKSDTENHSKNGENQVQSQGIESISPINPSFEENRPRQLIAPETFNKTYDYYIDNLELYFADENGKIQQIPARGMAVKIGSPVRSVVYLSNSKPN